MCSKKIGFNFIEHYQVDYSVLKFLCMWIHDGADKSTYYITYYVFINIFCVFLFNIAQTINAFVNSNTLTKLASFGYCVPICLLTNIKSYYLLKNKRHFYDLYSALKDDIFQPTTDNQLLIVRRLLIFQNRIKIFFLGICTVSLTAALTTPLFYKRSDQNLPFEVWYPFDISAKSIHIVMYLYQCVTIFHIVYQNAYNEILMTGFVTFVALQCDLLCDNLRKLDASDELCMRESLKKCIHHHWKILRFGKTTENLFSQTYFGHFVCSALVFCITLFLLTLVKRDNYEFFHLIAYQTANFGLLLIPCWFATEAKRKSENITFAAYECSWFDATKSTKKDLLYFMHRTQTPIQLFAIEFFHISVESFVWVFRTSLSWFAVLNSLNSGK